MTLAEMEAALHLHVADSSLKPYYQTWINSAILELAGDYYLPALKLLVPAEVEVTDSTWIFQLPTNFHKKLFRCVDSDYNDITVFGSVKSIEELDLDHDDTGDHVTHVAITPGNELAVYPLANDTVYCWYYRLPTLLAKANDIPDLMPVQFHERVILRKCLIKAYEHLQDQVENFDPKPLQYWRNKFTEGVHGSITEGPGLMKYLAMSEGGPRRTGGRDSIGARGN